MPAALGDLSVAKRCGRPTWQGTVSVCLTAALGLHIDKIAECKSVSQAAGTFILKVIPP